MLARLGFWVLRLWFGEEINTIPHVLGTAARFSNIVRLDFNLYLRSVITIVSCESLSNYSCQQACQILPSRMVSIFQTGHNMYQR